MTERWSTPTTVFIIILVGFLEIITFCKLLVSVLKGRVPNFIDTKDIISPLELYKKFLSEEMRGLLCVQFLAALNIFLEGSFTLSKDMMSKLFHNLSWQALRNGYDKVKLYIN